MLQLRLIVQVLTASSNAQHRAMTATPGKAAPLESVTAAGRLEKGPLGVREIHAATYDDARPVVTRRVTDS